MYFCLDEDGNVLECDMRQWGLCFSRQDRSIAFTKISKKVYLSTVFLGLDHSFGSMRPVLFESMLFGKKEGELQLRYCTREEALKGHLKILLYYKVPLKKIFSLESFRGNSRFHVQSLKFFKQMIKDKDFLEELKNFEP
ncbi:MAG: hypothetical protein EKK64_04265 [Neisseriaceae bacterium]|nr:MAG: hypothetical protein EKK64_04265 [Neisseriaceae bacterium]